MLTLLFVALHSAFHAAQLAQEELRQFLSFIDFSPDKYRRYPLIAADERKDDNEQ